MLLESSSKDSSWTPLKLESPVLQSLLSALEDTRRAAVSGLVIARGREKLILKLLIPTDMLIGMYLGR